ncbi:MAG: hypothetical protein EBQ96_04995 [Proteobacteria bacterium]|nr:hypothetical protein [Pseudomonadota bacterium]
MTPQEIAKKLATIKRGLDRDAARLKSMADAQPDMPLKDVFRGEDRQSTMRKWRHAVKTIWDSTKNEDPKDVLEACRLVGANNILTLLQQSIRSIGDERGFGKNTPFGFAVIKLFNPDMPETQALALAKTAKSAELLHPEKIGIEHLKRAIASALSKNPADVKEAIDQIQGFHFLLYTKEAFTFPDTLPHNYDLGIRIMNGVLDALDGRTNKSDYQIAIEAGIAQMLIFSHAEDMSIYNYMNSDAPTISAVIENAKKKLERYFGLEGFDQHRLYAPYKKLHDGLTKLADRMEGYEGFKHILDNPMRLALKLALQDDAEKLEAILGPDTSAKAEFKIS